MRIGKYYSVCKGFTPLQEKTAPEPQNQNKETIDSQVLARREEILKTLEKREELNISVLVSSLEKIPEKEVVTS